MKKNTYTHQYFTDVFGNEPFLIHEDDFENYMESLVEQCGPEYEHELGGCDNAGNPYYVDCDRIISEDDIDDNGMVELPFNNDGMYSPYKKHTWKVNRGKWGIDSITFVK